MQISSLRCVLTFNHKIPPLIYNVLLKFPTLLDLVMARITIEDCLRYISNPFDLILVASSRARQLMKGHAPKLNSHNKPAVMALREIASGQVGIGMLKKVPT